MGIMKRKHKDRGDRPQDDITGKMGDRGYLPIAWAISRKNAKKMANGGMVEPKKKTLGETIGYPGATKEDPNDISGKKGNRKYLSFADGGAVDEDLDSPDAPAAAPVAAPVAPVAAPVPVAAGKGAKTTTQTGGSSPGGASTGGVGSGIGGAGTGGAATGGASTGGAGTVTVSISGSSSTETSSGSGAKKGKGKGGDPAAPITLNISNVGGTTDAGNVASGDGPGASGEGGSGEGSGGGGGGAAPDEPENYSTSGKDKKEPQMPKYGMYAHGGMVEDNESDSRPKSIAEAIKRARKAGDARRVKPNDPTLPLPTIYDDLNELAALDDEDDEDMRKKMSISAKIRRKMLSSR